MITQAAMKSVMIFILKYMARSHQLIICFSIDILKNAATHHYMSPGIDFPKDFQLKTFASFLG
jgi:hypothetical protein